MRGALVAVLVVALFAALEPTVWAQQQDTGDKATARQLFHEAGEAMTAGDYAQAADLYARSNVLYPAPTAALGEARALVQLGRLLDASERYLALSRSELPDDASDAFKEAVANARRERELVMRRVPALVIRLEGKAEVSLDGKPLPAAALGVKRLVDPGTHHVSASVAGRSVFERELSIDEAVVVEVPIVVAVAEPEATQVRPDPASAPADHPLPTDEPGEPWGAQHTAGVVLLSLGAAGLVVWGATGIVYLRDRSTIDRECDAQKLCSQQGLDAVERGKTIGVVNTVSLFAGLGVAAAGLTVLLTAPDRGGVALMPHVSPSRLGLGISCRF